MIKRPKYETIEVVEFPLNPQYSGNPFTEADEYDAAVTKREQDISTYRDEKIEKRYNLYDFPVRTNIPVGNSGARAFFHVSQRYYARDNRQRILIAGNEESDVITVIFQTAKA